MNAHAAAIRRYFDAASDQYARGRAQEYSFTAQKRIALEFLPARSARVLDIGCGPAVLADELLERADAYSGIDLSPQMIAHGAARMKGHPQGSRCTLSVGDAEALAFPDASFDAVVALGLLEYLPSYEASIYVGIAAPHGTPSAVVEQLNKTINLAFVDANVSRRIADLGDAPLSLSSPEFAKLVIEETEKWRKVIVAGNIRAE